MLWPSIGVEEADLFGYSMGAGIALDIAVRHPELVRKLVVASLTYARTASASIRRGRLDAACVGPRCALAD
jgi:pimeloyl-ACP methyl ester carboxylesterase